MNTLTFETGVLDHYKLFGKMLRSTFAKGKSTKIFYRFYKIFENEKFSSLVFCSSVSIVNFEHVIASWV